MAQHDRSDLRFIRTDAPDEGRMRGVRITKRGRAAYAKILEILRDIEQEWSAELGPKQFAQLKEILYRVWDIALFNRMIRYTASGDADLYDHTASL